MASIDLSAEPELRLLFRNAKPFRALDLSRLLRDLSADYRRLYKGDLIVASISEGSLLARFRSTSNIADAANHILDFGLKLAGVLSLSAGAFNAVTQHQDQPQGVADVLKSAQSITSLAIKSHSQFQMSYSTPDGEKVFVDLPPERASHIEEHLRSATQAIKEKPAIRAISASSSDFASSDGYMYEALLERLSKISDEDRFSNLDENVKDVLRTLVEALDQTAPQQLQSLIHQLEMRGKHDAAQFSKSLVPPRSGDEPRILLPSR